MKRIWGHHPVRSVTPGCDSLAFTGHHSVRPHLSGDRGRSGTCESALTHASRAQGVRVEDRGSLDRGSLVLIWT